MWKLQNEKNMEHIIVWECDNDEMRANRAEFYAAVEAMTAGIPCKEEAVNTRRTEDWPEALRFFGIMPNFEKPNEELDEQIQEDEDIPAGRPYLDHLVRPAKRFKY